MVNKLTYKIYIFIYRNGRRNLMKRFELTCSLSSSLSLPTFRSMATTCGQCYKTFFFRH
jgi:hypothetical protein